MYWYKTKNSFIGSLTCALVAICLSACKPAIKEDTTLKYFDIKGYFQKESARLTKKHPIVLKTVTHNGVSETKKLFIGNWIAELGFFSSSDINKPAWRDSYAITADSNLTIYRAKDSTLKTREIVIKRVNGKINWILIYNKNKNFLYMTKEKLSYFPDSLYMVDKMQAVRVMGINRYQIRGTFNQ